MISLCSRGFSVVWDIKRRWLYLCWHNYYYRASIFKKNYLFWLEIIDSVESRSSNLRNFPLQQNLEKKIWKLGIFLFFWIVTSTFKYEFLNLTSDEIQWNPSKYSWKCFASLDLLKNTSSSSEFCYFSNWKSFK